MDVGTEDHGARHDQQRDPILTVVVPTHDVGPWLDDCLLSLRSQEETRLEILIVDDHSSDDTLEIAATHADQDPRIRVIRSEERGGAAARNLGIDLVDTKYLAFADGDDIVPPGAYRALIASLECTGSDLAVGNFLKFSPYRTWQPSKAWGVFDSRHERTTLADVPALIRNRAVWNRVFDTRFFRRAGIRFPDAVRSNDIVPMVAALTAAQSIDIIPDFVYLYRERPGATSMTARASSADAFASYLEQEARCADLLAGQPVETLRTYSRLFLDADGWVHLSKYLAAVASGEAKNDHRIPPRLAALLERMDPDVFAGRDPMRVLAFRLVADGRVDLAAAVVRSLQPGDSAAEFFAPRVEAVLCASRSGWLPPSRLADVTVALVFRPLVGALAATHPGKIREVLGVVQRALAIDLQPALAKRPETNPLHRVVAAAAAGDAELIDAFVQMHGAHFSADRLAAPAGWFEIDGTIAGSFGASSGMLLAACRETGRVARIRPVDITAGPDVARWSARFPRSSIPSAGTWELLVEAPHPRLGAIAVPVRSSGPGPAVPHRRHWSRVVPARSRTGEPLLVIHKGEAKARVPRVLRRLLRHGWSLTRFSGHLG